MAVYRNCTMENFSDADGQWEHPCQVRIGDGSITVSYELDGEIIVYQGPEIEPGHFRLTSDAVKGRATLHRFSDSDVLDGWWLESGYEGMWRVTLDE